MKVIEKPVRLLLLLLVLLLLLLLPVLLLLLELLLPPPPWKWQFSAAAIAAATAAAAAATAGCAKRWEPLCEHSRGRAVREPLTEHAAQYCNNLLVHMSPLSRKPTTATCHCS